MTLAGATQDEVRRHNLASLVRLLHEHGSLTRAEITARTGLNRSTVGVLASELVEAGLVTQTRHPGRGGAGRPSIVVQPRTANVHVIAIDIGAEHLTVARVGLGGTVLGRHELRYGRDETDIDEVLARLTGLVRAACAGAPADAVGVGVGVSVCGVVRRSDGLVRFAPNLAWTDVPLGALVAGALTTALPVAVGNDADLGAVAERTRGAAMGSDNVVYLSGDVGVGGGVVLDGRLLSGAGGYAGEVGHMRVNPSGRRCRCGAIGCWETEVGEEAILLGAHARPGATLADVYADYHRGDAAAREGVHHVGEWLGFGLANLVNMFNPDVVVLGGIMGGLFPYVQVEIDGALRQALIAPREQVRVVAAALGADSPMLGAAEAAFADLLDNPLETMARAECRLGA